MPTSAQLDQADSLHPTIRINFPSNHLSATKAAKCQPAVLVRLPPAIFIDSNTFPGQTRQSASSAKVASMRHLNSEHPSLTSYDFSKVEVEQGVGYSDRKGEQREQGKQEGSSSKYAPAIPDKEVKQVSSGQYIVANKESVHVRYQDEHADAQRHLAKEYRAALLTLERASEKEESINADHTTQEEEYDDLTGERIGRAESTSSCEIPIHIRYVEPIKGGDSWDTMWKAGNYEEVVLDKPEVMWMCKGVELLLDSTLYDRIDASDLLPSPHSHLSLQLPNHWNFYRLKLKDQDTPFKLSIPTGDISTAPYVHLATLTTFILAALWIVLQVQIALSKLHRAQVTFEKKKID